MTEALSYNSGGTTEDEVQERLRYKRTRDMRDWVNEIQEVSEVQNRLRYNGDPGKTQAEVQL